MTSPSFLILGGVAMIGTGLAHLLSENFARELLYRYAFGRREPFKSEAVEKFFIRINRFVIGPVLIVLGCLLVVKGL